MLLALIGYADANGFDEYAWQIAWTLGPFFNRRGRWRDYAATQATALAAAQRLGDTVALAHTHYLLGNAQAHMGDYEAASPNIRRALDLFRELGDRANEGMVLNGLASMLEEQERYPEALAVALDALRMLKAAGHWWSQGNLENGVGWLYAHLGQYDQALIHCQRALSLHRESGYRGGTADTWTASATSTCAWATSPRPRPVTPRPSRPTARSAPRTVKPTRWPAWATLCSPTATPPPPGRLARGRRDPRKPAAPAGRRGPGQARRPGSEAERGGQSRRAGLPGCAGPAEPGHLTGAAAAAR